MAGEGQRERGQEATFDLARIGLESGADGQPEGLARFAQLVERPIELLRFGVAEVARPAGREHAAGDQILSFELRIEAEGVVRVVDAGTAR